jgi:hypothetical protein
VETLILALALTVNCKSYSLLLASAYLSLLMLRLLVRFMTAMIGSALFFGLGVRRGTSSRSRTTETATMSLLQRIGTGRVVVLGLCVLLFQNIKG